MHELALTQSILEAVKPHVADDHRLTKVIVECGVLSGVVKESLDYCFSVVAPTLGFDRAELEVHPVRAAARCPVCAHETEVDSLWAPCPRCGHVPMSLEGGRDLRIKAIEVKEK
jgi:hydrogenase nickel incorporation protein HypA/HybF